MIVVFGSINLDLIFPLPALPRPGESLLSPAVLIQPGGKGANQAVAAARDGAQVAMIGAVGEDPLAEGALALLRKTEVDLSRVAIVPAPTGCAGIFVDRQGRNIIGVGSGANLAVNAEQLPDELLGPRTTVLLQMEVPPEETARVIARARRAGARIVLNLAPAGPLGDDALRGVDILVVNESETEWLARATGCEPSAAALHHQFGCTVVRTLGPEGAEAATRDGVTTIPGQPVEAVDTTGAGDCLTGVLAAALDRGLPFINALQRANIAAALCCMRSGSQVTMPTSAEIDAAMDSLPTRAG
jgi:ribokinase